MIIYNVTVKIEHAVKEDWLQWMREVHIPEVLSTGFFLNHRLSRLISMDESEGITYTVQYTCKDMATLHKYQVTEARRLQTEHHERYQDQYVAFRTLLEVIDPSE